MTLMIFHDGTHHVCSHCYFANKVIGLNCDHCQTPFVEKGLGVKTSNGNEYCQKCVSNIIIEMNHLDQLKIDNMAWILNTVVSGKASNLSLEKLDMWNTFVEQIDLYYSYKRMFEKGDRARALAVTSKFIHFESIFDKFRFVSRLNYEQIQAIISPRVTTPEDFMCAWSDNRS
jgi:hypothetical protein